MKSKKSQAFMEWIFTYGWAILAAIIAIGILAYFGVFTEGTYNSLDEQCLSERLCWDNGYEYNNYFQNEIRCYSISLTNNFLQKKFIKINWTALDEKYTCNG